MCLNAAAFFLTGAIIQDLFITASTTTMTPLTLMLVV